MELNPERLVNPPLNVDYLKCCVCFMICFDPVVSPCDHLFCRQHILIWLENKSNCPFCNAQLLPHQLKAPPNALLSLFENLEYYCNKGNTALKYHQIEAHEAECIQCGPTPPQFFHKSYSDVIYVGCHENQLLHGEKLGSITAYVSETIGIISSGANEKQYYEAYCKALKDKFGSFVPYVKSSTLLQWDQNIAVEQMKRLIPGNLEQFYQLIANFSLNLIPNMSAKFTLSEEFIVMKIFRSGENLEIIPCLMSVTAITKRSFLFWTRKSIELNIKYQQKTFTINKFDIEQIINEIKNLSEVPGRWDK